MKYFHVTARRNVEAILAEGLHTIDGGFDVRYVWFFDDRAIAEQARSGGSWGGSRGDNVIIEIDGEGLETIADPHPGWGSLRPGWDDHSRAHLGAIGPERLRLVTDVTLTDSLTGEMI